MRDAVTTGDLRVAALLVAGAAPLALVGASISLAPVGSLAIAFGLTWVPVAALTAELAASFPVRGGHYAWGRAAFGSGWGFVWAWWRLLVTIFEVGLSCAAIASLGLSEEVSPDAPARVVAFAVVMAIGCAIAARPSLVWPLAFVGAVALPAAVTLAPGSAADTATWPGAGALATAIGVMTMRHADVAGVVAGELGDSRRSIPRGIAIGSGLIAVLLVGPLASSLVAVWPLAGDGDASGMRSYFTAAALVALGAHGGTGIAVASRLVGAFATDRYLPAWFAPRDAGQQTWPSVVVVTAVAVASGLLDDVVLRACVTAAWCASLVALVGSLQVVRAGRAGHARGYRIPGGTQSVALCGAIAVAAAVVSVVDGLLSGGVPWAVASVTCIASGPIAWVGLTILVKRGRPNLPVALETAPRWFDSAQPGVPELVAPLVPKTPFAARLRSIVPRHRPVDSVGA